MNWNRPAREQPKLVFTLSMEELSRASVNLHTHISTRHWWPWLKPETEVRVTYKIIGVDVVPIHVEIRRENVTRRFSNRIIRVWDIEDEEIEGTGITDMALFITKWNELQQALQE